MFTLFYAFQSIPVCDWLMFMLDLDRIANFCGQGAGSAKEPKKISLQKIKAKVIDGDTFEADRNRNGKFFLS